MDWSTSSLPVERHHAAKSLMDPGSVARTSRRVPEAIVLAAWAVRTIGIGHESPRASTLVVISTVSTIRLLPNRDRPDRPYVSDEDQLAFAGIEVEPRHPLDATTERD